MAEPKTKKNEAGVAKFLAGVENEQRREDAKTVLAFMKKVTRCEPKMWGTSLVGFGSYHYEYASGRDGDWPLTAFSPRKQNLTLYVMSGFSKYDALMKTLGKYKTGMSCLYINRLEDVDLGVLETLVRESVAHMKKSGSSRTR